VHFISPNTFRAAYSNRYNIDTLRIYEKKVLFIARLHQVYIIDGRAHARCILDPNTVAADPVSGARDHLLCWRSTRIAVVVRMLFSVFSTCKIFIGGIFINRCSSIPSDSRKSPSRFMTYTSNKYNSNNNIRCGCYYYCTRADL